MDEKPTRGRHSDATRMMGAGYAHSLRIDNGVPVVDLSGLAVILDTGSPTSFGTVGALDIQGREFPLASHYLNLDIDAINRHLRSPVAALIGTDILREFVVMFDFGTSVLRMNADQPSAPQDAVRVTEVMGVPVVSARLEGADQPMIIDTGAALSYLVPSVAEACKGVGATMDDFMPLLGPFRTELFEGHLSVGRSIGILRFGVLPPPLDGLLGLLGVSGVIGLNAVGSGCLTLSLAGNWATIDRVG
ncbi:MAG: hypothetical protein EXQ92_08340 [Alphaproteobacteria bacterium]|nr:hypothetical protein [Alphaproteobacteria bacterium]